MGPLPYSFNIAATICVDTAESDDGVEYPLMGNVTADERRIFYWRMALVLMVTSRQCNPNQGHVLITNDQAPVLYDGLDLRAYLAEQGVQILYRPFTQFRMPKGVSTRFANAFYKLESHAVLAGLDKPSILLDTDVVWARRIPAFEEKLAAGTPLFYDTYQRSAEPDSRKYAATSMRDFGNMFRDIDATYPNPLPVALGGEVAAGSPQVFAELNADLLQIFRTVMDRVQNGPPLPGGESSRHFLNTEDVMLSMAVCRRTDVEWINPWLKRIYNLGYLNNLKAGDEQRLAIWHLPGEKQRGLSNLYAFITERDPRFWQASEEDRARFIGAVVGVPRRRIRRATDPSWFSEQVRIARGRAGIFRNKLFEALGIFHHR